MSPLVLVLVLLVVLILLGGGYPAYVRPRIATRGPSLLVDVLVLVLVLILVLWLVGALRGGALHCCS